ncbi:hypothetical protein [Massilia agri]|uniref:Uncharacterized protein n=1 Tax=Massilia agri TaxID=1886785 RepID=A0ABT2AHI0_9BURK|nr:hypothetical protein [Massilia agri]MCS0595645.1 hypothetical protein [Massilia agri]
MRSFFKLFLVRWLLAVIVSPGLVYAQAKPASMQAAVSALVVSKAGQRGFAANDPRIASTMQGIGSTVAGGAAAAAVVTAAGVTAPAWVTAAVVVGLGALFSAGISLAVDKIAAWWFDSDGSVKVQLPSTGPALVDYLYTIRPNNDQDMQACVQTSIYNWCDETGPNIPGCLAPGASNPTNFCRPGWAPDGKTSTTFQDAMARAGYSYRTTTAPGPIETKTAADAVAALTDEQKAAPLNPEVLAAIADQAWKTASEQPGYTGVPYSSSNPITAADAAAYQSANPTTYPTVGDAVAPVTAPAGQPASAPWTPVVPSTGTQPSTGGETGETNNPESKPIDWGVFAPPVLEATPSIESILDPLLNLWPAWSSFSFPAHQSECPTPSFSLPGSVLNGHTLHFTQMCDFLEANNVRVALQAAFAVAWALLILFIVMGA